ncbi:hypothetical protein TW81_07260 [Vibrio galatheae]|uniref:Uncharacterized protein n=1 Tax=Vibrio galatheae TaxID=579748 RepID=A0A0F4NL38_9VIBR|nr:hypothetical protein [Vibrio galatheae]KJY83569.1 hypothetical protein TW81_07260 [Vibrio galatheae]
MTITTEYKTALQQDLMPLLGEALIAVQKVDFALYKAIQPLCKQHPNRDLRALSRLTANQFLQGTSADVTLRLQPLHNMLNDELPMSVAEISDFVSKRNLITQQFWQLTDAPIKGGEKIAQPVPFLQQLLSQCDKWMERVEKVDLKAA